MFKTVGEMGGNVEKMQGLQRKIGKLREDYVK